MPTTAALKDRSESAIRARVASLTTVAMTVMCRRVYDDPRPGTEVLLPILLDALELRLSEAEFVAFCRTEEARIDTASKLAA